MAWIESHEELENHPKVIDLESRMGWDRDQTIGKLHRFWWWCLKYAPTGDLSKFNDSQIGGGVVLNIAESKKFVEAMIASRWIDRCPGIFRVHDWPRYAGTYLRGSKFKREPARWQETVALYELKESQVQSNDCPETVPRQSRVPTNQPTNPPTNPRERQGAQSTAAEEPDGIRDPMESLSDWETSGLGVLATSECIRAIAEWFAHLRANLSHKIPSPISWRAKIAEMQAWGPPRTVAAIRHSIASNWGSIHEPGGKGKSASKNPMAGMKSFSVKP